MSLPQNQVSTDSMKDRIRWIRKRNQLSQVQIANRLHVSQSVISLIESGQASASVDIIKKLSQEFEVSCDWLIFGNDDYVKVATDNSFIPLVDSNKIDNVLSNSNIDDDSSSNMYKIPGFENGQFRIFTVEDDSMLPSLSPGDKVIGEKVTSPQLINDGALYAMVIDGRVHIKRLQKSKSNPHKIILKSEQNYYVDEEYMMDLIDELWSVKSKLTSTFIDQTHAQNKRLENLETELARMKEQIYIINQKSKGLAYQGSKSKVQGGREPLQA